MPKKSKPRKPKIELDLFCYIEAFYDLSSCRAIGMGAVGQIPYTAILQWVDYWGVDQPELFISIVQSLDHIYLEHVNKDKEEVKSG